MPPLSQNTFKRREREIGKAVEKLAKLSCQNATEQEKILSLENGNSVDTDGLVGITCSYDMG